MPSVFGYWTLRGLGQACQLMLEYTGEEYQDNRFDLINAEDKWIEEKNNPYGLAFPNLPYYVDGDIKMTQSMAILRHLARKYNMAANNDAEARELDMLEGVVRPGNARDLNSMIEGVSQDLRTWWGCTRYKMEQFKEVLPELKTKVALWYKQLSDYLDTRTWFLGDHMTYTDVQFYDLFTIFDLLDPSLLDGADNLRGLVKRFEALPNVKKYMDSDRFIKAPLNGPSAAFGGK